MGQELGFNVSQYTGKICEHLKHTMINNNIKIVSKNLLGFWEHMISVKNSGGRTLKD